MEAKKREKNGTDEGYSLFEPDRLKDFIRFFEDRDITHFEISIGGDSLSLSKAPGVPSHAAPAPVPPPPAPAAPPPAAVAPPSAPPAPAPAAPPAGKLAEITAPLVGTLYTAPSPKDPPFVKAGDTVKKGQTVCIIEAMKVFNNIPAEVDGVIREVCVKNEQPVEFGQVLFRVEAS